MLPWGLKNRQKPLGHLQPSLGSQETRRTEKDGRAIRLEVKSFRMLAGPEMEGKQRAIPKLLRHAMSLDNGADTAQIYVRKGEGVYVMGYLLGSVRLQRLQPPHSVAFHMLH